MDKPIITKCPFVFGLPTEIKDIHGLPRGKVRLRFRAGQFAKLFVRNENVFGAYHLRNDGTHWHAVATDGANHRFRV